VLLKQRFGAKLVYDAHEFEPERATKMPPEGNQMVDLLERDCLDNIDALITVSDSIGELYAARFPKRAPVIVMNAPEGAETPVSPSEEEKQGAQSLRSKIKLNATTPLVVFTGGIQKEHRGLDKVLEALARLPGYHLVTMGPRHEKNDDWFLSHARMLGLEDRVHLAPPVDARDVPRMISSCNVAICPFQDVSLNHRFALPNKLFEAAFAGVPICVSDLPEMRRFVDRLGIGRSMDQTDPDSIAAALRDTVEHGERYRLTAGARSLLEQEFSWAAQKKKLVALYDQLI
jgi:glycosyltransferase involved in cell wall biosynthesis